MTEIHEIKMTPIAEWYPLYVKWPATIAHYRRMTREKWGPFPQGMGDKEVLIWINKPND